MVYLIGQGVLDVADADDAVSWGPGLRWGVMGPNLLWHLGGGEGGIQHFMDTLMPRMAAGWPGLGNPDLTPELAQQIVDGVLKEADGKSIDELAHRRDDMLFGLIAVRDKYGPSDVERERRTMLSVMYGVLAMMPTTFAVAGYALVSRH